MTTPIHKMPKLDLMGEFADAKLEREFSAELFGGSRKLIARLYLLGGVVFFSMLFMDASLLSLHGGIAFNVAMRGCMLLLSVVFAVLILRWKKPHQIPLLELIFCLLVAVCYHALLLHNGDLLFMEQAASYMLLMLTVFCIPGRLVCNLVFCGFCAALFLGTAPLSYGRLQPYQFYGAASYLALCTLISAISMVNLNVYRRHRFFRERQLEQMIGIDRLTGIHNRLKFDATLKEWLQLAERGRFQFSLIMFDLDNFKRLNDTYGHLLGDATLVSCVREIGKVIRGADVFARWGGEEFIVLLAHADLGPAADVAERMRQQLECCEVAPGVTVTASFGVTRHRVGDTADTLITRADNLMYRAKQSGKNRVCSADGDGSAPAGAVGAER